MMDGGENLMPTKADPVEIVVNSLTSEQVAELAHLLKQPGGQEILKRALADESKRRSQS
jgi:hypothetical protein